MVDRSGRIVGDLGLNYCSQWAPTSYAPTSDAPTALANIPTSQAPTTDAPTTDVPTSSTPTKQPTSQAPVTISPVNNNSTYDSRTYLADSCSKLHHFNGALSHNGPNIHIRVDLHGALSYNEPFAERARDFGANRDIRGRDLVKLSNRFPVVGLRAELGLWYNQYRRHRRWSHRWHTVRRRRRRHLS